MNCPSLRPIERGGDRHLDAELVRPVRFALADAFDFGGVQRIDFSSALVLALMAHPEGERQRLGEDPAQIRIAPCLAHDVALDRTPNDMITRPTSATISSPSATCPMKSGSSGGPYMHLKAYSIDGGVLRTGSANFSTSGERAQDSDLIVIPDAGAAGQVRRAL
jgi:phosphatidylserine/phosphatidylglycerophosphate/cardiolipin synthase-like enzyme